MAHGHHFFLETGARGEYDFTRELLYYEGNKTRVRGLLSGWRRSCLLPGGHVHAS